MPHGFIAATTVASAGVWQVVGTIPSGYQAFSAIIKVANKGLNNAEVDLGIFPAGTNAGAMADNQYNETRNVPARGGFEIGAACSVGEVVGIRSTVAASVVATIRGYGMAIV